MSALGTLSNIFGGNPNPYRAQAPVNEYEAQQAQLDESSYADAIKRAQENALAVNPQQQALADALSAAAAGNGPSVAQNQLKQATDQNVKQAAGMIASQRGVNPAMAARVAAQQGAQANQSAAGQAATLRAQEQIAARGQLGETLNQMQTGATSLAGTTGQLQNAQNTSRIQNLMGAQTLNQATAAQNANLNLGAQQINAGVAAQNAAANSALVGGFIEGMGNALASAGSSGGGGGLGGIMGGGGGAGGGAAAAAHGGEIMPRRYAGGGAVSPWQIAAKAAGEQMKPIGRRMAESTVPAFESLSRAPTVPDAARGDGNGPIRVPGAEPVATDTSAPEPAPDTGPSSPTPAPEWRPPEFLREDALQLRDSPMIERAGSDSPALPNTGMIGQLARGGAIDFRPGGSVPGKARVRGDSPRNDTVPAIVSPGEIVLPRTVAQAQNAPDRAAEFVAAIKAQKGGGSGEGYGRVLAATRALDERLGRLERMAGGGEVKDRKAPPRDADLGPKRDAELPTYQLPVYRGETAKRPALVGKLTRVSMADGGEVDPSLLDALKAWWAKEGDAQPEGRRVADAANAKLPEGLSARAAIEKKRAQYREIDAALAGN